MTLLVLYNPVCGSSGGKSITETHVVPLLISQGRVPDKIISTEHAGHAGTIVVDLINQAGNDVDLTVILVSGDGTLHEIVNAVYSSPVSSESVRPTIRIALVPAGTANALHSTLFPPPLTAAATETPTSSPQVDIPPNLLSALHASRTIPLALGQTTLQPSAVSSTHQATTSVLSAVVASTSLHASILADAESLRSSIPGLDRFKVAAAQNANRWYSARLRLLPETGSNGTDAGSGTVKRYDPHADMFVEVPEAERELTGPFAYALSVVNVDRLEPSFRIAPLQRAIPPETIGTADLVVVRPSRDPAFNAGDEKEREAFKDKIWAAMGGAYQDGVHVRLTYAPDGKIVPGGEGPSVAEYFRVGGWEWTPLETDDRAHLVCTDGAIHHIPKGGKASFRVPSASELGFDVQLFAF